MMTVPTLYHEEKWLRAMAVLPVLPRVLFHLYSFDHIEPAAMAVALETDSETVMLCLTEARKMILGHRHYRRADRLDPSKEGSIIASLERETRLRHRRWVDRAFADSGYVGTIAWPDLSAIDGDEAAVRKFILFHLPTAVRNAVARAEAPGGMVPWCWRYLPPWRGITRRHRVRLAHEVARSGWLAYPEWLAEMIAPDRHYPDGLDIGPCKRRPLPRERPATDEDITKFTAEQRAAKARLDRLPILTQQSYLLDRRYGRTREEIAERLGISRRNVDRRVRLAIFVMAFGKAPSFRHIFSFECRLQWSRWQRRTSKAWQAMRD